jgi:hypothetical protein
METEQSDDGGIAYQVSVSVCGGGCEDCSIVIYHLQVSLGQRSSGLICLPTIG